jgi:hypothetical protein
MIRAHLREQLFCTPPHLVKALLKRESFPGTIWEPAAGEGHIVKVLRACGYDNIIASDLNNWGFRPCLLEDFLTSSRTSDSLITNPPFNRKRQFLKHAMRQVRRKIALLLPTDFEHTVEFVRHHETNQELPWKALYSFPQGIRWENVHDSWGKFKCGWFVFERGYTGPLIREKILFRRNRTK